MEAMVTAEEHQSALKRAQHENAVSIAEFVQVLTALKSNASTYRMKIKNQQKTLNEVCVDFETLSKYVGTLDRKQASPAHAWYKESVLALTKVMDSNKAIKDKEGDMRDVVRKARLEIADLNHTSLGLEENLDSTTHDLEQLKKQSGIAEKNLTAEIALLSARIGSRADEISKSREDTESCKEELRSSERHCNELQGTVNEIQFASRKEVEESVKRKNEIEEQYDAAVLRVKELQEEKNDIEVSSEKYGRDLIDSRVSERKLEREIASLRSSVAEKHSEYDAVFQGMDEKNASQGRMLLKQQDNIAAMRKALQVLKDQKRQKEEECEEMRGELEKAYERLGKEEVKRKQDKEDYYQAQQLYSNDT
jgi:chromosome segregation ATPase